MHYSFQMSLAENTFQIGQTLAFSGVGQALYCIIKRQFGDRPARQRYLSRFSGCGADATFGADAAVWTPALRPRYRLWSGGDVSSA